MKSAPKNNKSIRSSDPIVIHPVVEESSQFSWADFPLLGTTMDKEFEEEGHHEEDHSTLSAEILLVESTRMHLNISENDQSHKRFKEQAPFFAQTKSPLLHSDSY